MKREFKQLCCILLAVVLFLPHSMITIAAETPNHPVMITIPCISTLCDVDTIDILVYEKQGYIKSIDATMHSGYNFQMKNGSRPTFTRDDQKVVVEESISYQDEIWFPIEHTLEQLSTDVNLVNDCLLIRGKEHLPEELIEYTNSLMFDNNIYRVTDTEGYAGNLGVIGATIYNVAAEFDIFKRITGQHEVELYEEIFGEVLEGADSEPIIGVMGKASKYSSRIYDIMAFSESDEEGEILMNYVTDAPVSDSLQNLYGVKTTLGAAYDPLGTLINTITIDGKQIFGDNISIKGLDLGTQAKIYTYFDSIINCSQLNANMILHTYYSDYFSLRPLYLPDAARSIVEDISNYYGNMEYADILGEYIKEEVGTITSETLGDLVDDALLMGYDKPMKIAQFLLNTSFDWIFDDMSEKMDFIEKSKCITELQSGIMAAYRKYVMTTPESAFNAKYAAMLYIRLKQLNYQLQVDSNVINESGATNSLYTDPLEKLVLYSDYDLTNVTQNEYIDFDGFTEEIVDTEQATNENSSWSSLTDKERFQACLNTTELIFKNESQVIETNVIYFEPIPESTNDDRMMFGWGESVADIFVSSDTVSGWLSNFSNIYLDLTADENGISYNASISFNANNGNAIYYWKYGWDGNLIETDSPYGGLPYTILQHIMLAEAQ